MVGAPSSQTRRYAILVRPVTSASGVSFSRTGPARHALGLMLSSSLARAPLTWQAAHLALSFATFFVALLVGKSLALLGLAAATLLAALVYVPATLVLSARQAATSFDSARGEQAYAVFQAVVTGAAFILSAVARARATCILVIYNPARGDEKVYDFSRPCHGYEAALALSAAQSALAIAWAAWVGRAARAAGRGTRVPVHELLGGYRPLGARTAGAHANDDDEWKAVNPYDDVEPGFIGSVPLKRQPQQQGPPGAPAALAAVDVPAASGEVDDMDMAEESLPPALKAAVDHGTGKL